MTSSAIRPSTPRAAASTRTKRARRFWGTMGAALRFTAAGPGSKVALSRSRAPRSLALRTV